MNGPSDQDSEGPFGISTRSVSACSPGYRRWAIPLRNKIVSLHVRVKYVLAGRGRKGGRLEGEGRQTIARRCTATQPPRATGNRRGPQGARGLWALGTHVGPLPQGITRGGQRDDPPEGPGACPTRGASPRDSPAALLPEEEGVPQAARGRPDGGSGAQAFPRIGCLKTRPHKHHERREASPLVPPQHGREPPSPRPAP